MRQSWLMRVKGKWALLNQRTSLREEFAGVAFNSLLANLYRNGQDGMGWHADDERELGPTPVIGSLSFGAARKFQLRRRDNHREKRELELASGDLLVMSGRTQTFWQHQVPKTSRPVGPRINLTFRQIVPKR
jgi:alkylated DNA repair dioxygenase AlkB